MLFRSGWGRVEDLLFWVVVGTNVEGGLGGKTVGLGEGNRREGRVLWCAGEKGSAAEGAGFCGWGWFEGTLFWLEVGVNVEGGMGVKTVGVG